MLYCVLRDSSNENKMVIHFILYDTSTAIDPTHISVVIIIHTEVYINLFDIVAYNGRYRFFNKQLIIGVNIIQHIQNTVRQFTPVGNIKGVGIFSEKADNTRFDIHKEQIVVGTAG